MPTGLRTKWYRVAVSGDSIDGRDITDNEINELAETYNPKFYTALLWIDHIRDFGNYGKVIALKAETISDESDPLNGKVALYAILAPNQYLINLNKQGQKLFSSIEIWPDFAKSQKVYLAGMAIVDQPGSVGVEVMKFKQKTDDACILSEPKNFGLTSILNSMGEVPANAFAQIPLKTPKPEDEEMNKEQFDQFIAQQATQHEATMEAMKAFIAKPAETPKPKDDDGDGSGGDDSGSGGETPSKNFASKTDMETLTQAVTKLSEDFKAAMGEEHGGTDADGEGEQGFQAC